MLTIYSKNTSFKNNQGKMYFDSLGYGVLKDLYSDPLITEELNGSYILEFEYKIDGVLNEYLIDENIIKANGQPFVIYDIKKDTSKISILAKHWILNEWTKDFLIDVAPTNLNSQNALKWIQDKGSNQVNISVNGDCENIASARYVRKNIINAIFNEDNALLTRFGGELSYDKDSVFINKKRGSFSGITIRERKNLSGIEFHSDFSTVATRLLPLGKDGLMLDSIFVDSPIIDSYSTPVIKKVEIDSDNQDELHDYCQTLFENDIDKPTISIKIDFIELSKTTEYSKYSNLESIHLGDTVLAYIPSLDLNIKTRVVKTVYNCNLKRITSLELGTCVPNIAFNNVNIQNDVNKMVNERLSFLAKAKSEASDLMKHPFDGYIFLDENQGCLYIADNKNLSEANDVWKWGLGGLGFSSTGINGAFETAITQDGKIVADFITTGKLNTNVIEGYGSLTLQVKSNTDSLSNLSNTVDTLSNDIDGVSADFEDFKDNEYIQSIDNLQKQIDGAIQFWNGAEIPTINNYPANEWTTENDKINHQADIYTVVQDVEGEMKQGKSYRFDKVGGVWQWIELTDNELSAVQALAQDALNKANTNANEIGTVKSSVSELQQTDEQIKASVESIDKQIIPTAPATSSNIYVEDASDDPLIELEIEGKSKQKTRSGKNSVNDLLIGAWNLDKTMGYPSSTIYKSFSAQLKAGVYTLSCNTNISLIRAFTDYDNSSNIILSGTYINVTSYTFTITEDTTLYMSVRRYDNTDWLDTDLLQLESGEIATEYEPYGVSPSPDYPSEIESVGYENLLNLTDVIETTLNEITYSVSNQKLTLNGTGTSGKYTWILFTKNNVYGVNGTPNANYITTRADGIISTGLVSKFIQEFSGSTTYNIQMNLYDDAGVTVNNALTKDTNIVAVGLYLGNNQTYTNYTLGLQVEKGTQQHSYIPHGKYGIEVETVGKNIWGNISWQTQTYSYFKLPKENDYYTLSIRLKDGATIPSDLYLGFTEKGVYDASQRIFWFIQSGNINTPLIKDNFYYINNLGNLNYVSVYPSSYVNKLSDYFDIQLEYGNEFTEYEQYQSNISVIVLNEPLRSLRSGVKDIAYIKNNILYVDREIGSRIFNGTENWLNWSGFPENDFIGFILPNVVDYDFSKSTVVRGLSDYFNVGVNGPTNRQVLGLRQIGDYSQIYITISKSVVTTLDEFKKWLASHNLQLDYKLATPIIEELGEIQMPSTFKGVNHISTTDELEPTINIEYVRDTTLSSYVEGQVANAVAIQERKNAEFQIQNDEIKASVSETQSSLDGAISNMNKLESSLTSQSATLEIISKNIDKTTGEVREVTTINGITLDKDGLNFHSNQDAFNTQIDRDSTEYKDGDKLVSMTSKDGFLSTNSKEKGHHYYSYNKKIPDEPLNPENYDFIDERIEVDGEVAHATFWNGEE